MTDTAADAGVVQSRVQLERLVAEDELAGRTIAGFAAPSVGLRSVDLDGVTIERLDLQGADGDDAGSSAPSSGSVDLRTSQWKGALWHRVTAKDCDLTELDFTGAAAAALRARSGADGARAVPPRADPGHPVRPGASCTRRTSRTRS